MRHRSSFLGLGLILVLVATPHLAAAKGKSLFKAKVGPINFKANIKPSINASMGFNNGFFILTGTMRKGSLRSSVITNYTVTCTTPGGPVAGTTYTCGGGIQEGGLGGAIRGWTSDDQLSATVTKFDGKRISGTFEGTMENVGDINPPDAQQPAPVTGGKFSAKIVTATIAP